MRRLEIDPELGGGVKRQREQPCSLGGDAALSADKFVDALHWHAEMRSECNLRDAKRLEELLTQDYAGVRGNAVIRDHGATFLFVIVLQH
jgi:hypothetical protein